MYYFLGSSDVCSCRNKFCSPPPIPLDPHPALLECPVKSLDRDRQGEEGPLIVFRRKFMAGRKQPGEATPMASQPVKVLAKGIESYNGSKCGASISNMSMQIDRHIDCK